MTMTKISELYGVKTGTTAEIDWKLLITAQQCPFLSRKCLKIRKSRPELSIGTCTVSYGKENRDIIICPSRLLERQQIFFDCLHLLKDHEPGNELHMISEVGIPGGNVDYFLVSVRQRAIKDFVGIELQTLDTTGTIWPERQRFAQSKGVEIENDDDSLDSDKGFGMNWKMTAKTILIQLHHKVETFQELNKHLVLVIQDHFMNYIRGEFQFSHLIEASTSDSAHFHVYKLDRADDDSTLRLQLDARFSTDANGIAKSLGMQTSHIIEVEKINALLLSKMSARTLLQL